ncbi:RNA-directed DNA polymerase (reverse transcriptase)-related family protein [Striga hermonthica]|uniref:RNA-directed DNA polymerase (Reverse transcriptase)-related family protein n=1 Tax=Striga hermonthica TaxID=68872 RepID=A0A9N7N0X1_STRHE|nr:RNA-directed DNA polymerase (reverse transcriptase)-related family protein [Striga hermonthica]
MCCLNSHWCCVILMTIVYLDSFKLLSFGIKNNLGKYLGIPILHGRVTRNAYSHIVDKVESRLAKWRMNTFSMVGRLTLTQTVLSTLPYYSMQAACYHVPLSMVLSERVVPLYGAVQRRVVPYYFVVAGFVPFGFVVGCWL